MDELDSNVYYGIKVALRKVVKNISEDNLKYNRMPIVLIDFYKWEVFYFEDKYDAQEFLEEHYSNWDDEPPEGEDEELILLKFCTDREKLQYEHIFKGYKFYKQINGKNIYRERSFVKFEPELVINISI